MARRKQSSGGMSLDSLMDTLTNVVGILLIILIFAVLSGADTVKRIRGFVDEISDNQMSQTIAEAEALRKLVEDQKAALDELELHRPNPELSLERQRELIDQLKSELAKLAAAEIDVVALKKDVEERKLRVRAIEAEIVEKEKLIASLKARLADHAASGPDPDARVVNLPDPREAPKGAQPVVFICRRGRIVPVDIPGLQQKAQQIIRDAQRVLVRQNRLDCERMAELFEKRFVGDRFCQLKIRVGGDAKPYLLVDTRADIGDKAEMVGRFNSQFIGWIKPIDPQKQYIEFRVFSDSYETYLEARNAAAKRGISAGWIPYSEAAEYWIGLGIDLKMTCLGRDPPAAVAAQPANPNRPPPPPDVID